MNDSIIARLGLDSASFQKGLQQAGALANQTAGKMGVSFGALSSSLSMLGGSFVTAFSFGKAMEKAHEISLVSKQFGVTAVEAQKLGAVGKASGLDMETAAKGARKAWIEVQKALAGDSNALNTFDRLGISAKKLATLKGPADTLAEMSEAVSTAKNKHVALAAATDIVGARQSAMIGVLKMGRAEMERLGNSAVIMGDKTVSSLEKANKAISRTRDYATVGAGVALGGLSDFLEPAATRVGAISAGNWYDPSEGKGNVLESDEQERAKVIKHLRDKSALERSAGRNDAADKTLAQAEALSKEVKKQDDIEEGIRAKQDIALERESKILAIRREGENVTVRTAEQELVSARILAEVAQNGSEQDRKEAANKIADAELALDLAKRTTEEKENQSDIEEAIAGMIAPEHQKTLARLNAERIELERRLMIAKPDERKEIGVKLAKNSESTRQAQAAAEDEAFKMRATTAVMQLMADGQERMANELKTELSYREQINTALRDGNTELERQLRQQAQIWAFENGKHQFMKSGQERADDAKKERQAKNENILYQDAIDDVQAAIDRGGTKFGENTKRGNIAKRLQLKDGDPLKLKARQNHANRKEMPNIGEQLKVGAGQQGPATKADFKDALSTVEQSLDTIGKAIAGFGNL